MASTGQQQPPPPVPTPGTAEPTWRDFGGSQEVSPPQTLGVFLNITFWEALRLSCPKHPQLLGGERGGKQGVPAGSWS